MDFSCLTFHHLCAGKISIILSGMNFIPKSPKNNDDEEAAAVARQFTVS